MDFDFGCAKALYEKKVHPRVLLGPRDVEVLRAMVRKGDAKKIMQAIRARTRPHVEWLLSYADLAASFTEAAVPRGTPAYGALGAAREMATVALVDEDDDAIEALRRLFANGEWTEFRGRAVLPAPVAYDMAFDFLPEESKRAYRKAAVADAKRRVRDAGANYFHMSGHNITLGVGAGAFWNVLGVLGDPGVPDLTREIGELVRMLEATLHVVYGPDGYPEEDMGYGTLVGASMSLLAETLRRAGIYDPYAACPRYAEFGRAVLHFVQPWGENLSTTGDHGDDFGMREFVLPCLARETDDPTLLWLLGTLSYPTPESEVPLRPGFRMPASTLSLLSLGAMAKPVHPARAKVGTAFRDRGRGIVSFRSGWRADDAFAVFDGSQRSPSAQGHFHASCGHFSLSALGEYFAIDTGRYNIEQNCHNVVLVDGKSGRSTDGEWSYAKHDGVLIDYVPDTFVDFAAVNSSHQHDCFWARRCLGLVKGPGAPSAYVWTVDDINKANDFRQYWWQLHTCPENVIRTRTHSAAIKGWRRGNWLDVHWILPDPAEYSEPHRLLSVTQDVATTSSYKYVPDPHSRVSDVPRPADMIHWSVFVRPRLLAKFAGLNGRILSLMVPRRKGEPAARVTRLPSVPNSLAARIRFADVEDTVIFAYEHNLLEAGDVVGRGQWCVVRRSRNNGRILAHALGHGTGLAVGGPRPDAP